VTEKYGGNAVSVAMNGRLHLILQIEELLLRRDVLRVLEKSYGKDIMI